MSRAALGSSDQGSATVLVVALLALVAVLAGAAALLGQVEVARARAQTAADLAALAGAGRLALTQDVASSCARAVQVASRNGTRLADCAEPAAQVLAVRVEVATPVGLAAARASAGPASARAPTTCTPEPLRRRC